MLASLFWCSHESLSLVSTHAYIHTYIHIHTYTYIYIHAYIWTSKVSIHPFFVPTEVTPSNSLRDGDTETERNPKHIRVSGSSPRAPWTSSIKRGVVCSRTDALNEPAFAASGPVTTPSSSLSIPPISPSLASGRERLWRSGGGYVPLLLFWNFFFSANLCYCYSPCPSCDWPPSLCVLAVLLPL